MIRRGLVLVLLLGVGLLRAAEPSDSPAPYQPWPEAAVAAMRSLPVQDAGRVKPLHTAAAFTLLRFSGRRSLRHGEHTLEPTAWALDVFFRPDLAADQPLFQVQTSEVLDAIGVDHEQRKKRDRYSYRELLSGRDDLMAQAQRSASLDEAERDYLQRQILDLAANLQTFEAWIATGAFVQSPMPLSELGALLAPLLEGPPPSAAQLEAGGLSPEHARGLLDVLGFVRALLARPTTPAVLPPLEAEAETWFTITDFLTVALRHDGGAAWAAHWRALELWHDAALVADEPEAFVAAVVPLRDHLVGMAREHAAYAGVESEVAFYRANLLTHSLMVFLLAFVAVAALWIRPRSRALAGAAWGLTGIALALLVAAITWRCILRGRPPITTLYETVLFITASIGLVCLVAEWLTRQRLALSLAPILGALGLFLAFRYETIEASDTMPQLVAVLDTNFWLATHVTTVTLGYAAALLAGVTGAFFLLGRLLGLKRDDEVFYATVARTTYGIICFGLVFSVVGTILGGIWANDSWGRFWGWDPKENGALMIVLIEIAILHARLSGWIRERGIAMAAVANFSVVVFSWWHVNQLGTGLHSYGHTDGVMRGILIAYAVTALVLVLGALSILLDRRRTRLTTD